MPTPKKKSCVPGVTHPLSPFTQGSLLKVVLDDYMRLKRLFAQRMVHKATASQGDRSSVTEVDGACGGMGRCLPCPLGCSVSSQPRRLWLLVTPPPGVENRSPK